MTWPFGSAQDAMAQSAAQQQGLLDLATQGMCAAPADHLHASGCVLCGDSQAFRAIKYEQAYSRDRHACEGCFVACECNYAKLDAEYDRRRKLALPAPKGEEWRGKKIPAGKRVRIVSIVSDNVNDAYKVGEIITLCQTGDPGGRQFEGTRWEEAHCVITEGRCACWAMVESEDSVPRHPAAPERKEADGWGPQVGDWVQSKTAARNGMEGAEYRGEFKCWRDKDGVGCPGEFVVIMNGPGEAICTKRSLRPWEGPTGSHIKKREPERAVAAKAEPYLDHWIKGTTDSPGLTNEKNARRRAERIAALAASPHPLDRLAASRSRRSQVEQCKAGLDRKSVRAPWDWPGLDEFEVVPRVRKIGDG